MSDVVALLIILAVPLSAISLILAASRRGSARWYRVAGSGALLLAPVGGLLTVTMVFAYDNGPGRTDWIGGTGVMASLSLQAIAFAVALRGLTRSASSAGTQGPGLAMLVSGVSLGAAAVIGIVALVAWDVS
jgi:hypothetical protein